MTKEITKAIILQEMQDKLKLREFLPEPFVFSETVVPIYDIEPHLVRPQIKNNTVSVTAGPAACMFFSVPIDEKWRLHGYNVIFKTGVYTVAGLMIYRGGTVSNYFYIDLEAGQSASYINNLSKDVLLDPTDQIHLYVDGYTSTGNLELRIDVTVEEIR